MLRMKCSLICWYTLTYGRGKLGIGCIRFKHAGIRWYTLVYAGIRWDRNKFVSMLKNVGRMSPYGLYANHTLDIR